MSRRIIDTNGAAIQVVEAGAGDPALVFLHYWGGSSRTWQAVIDQLGGTPRSIALDQRGWGESCAMDGRYDLRAMADDAEAVARTLEVTRYVLVGHSMGGKVAQIIAARRPAGLVGLVRCDGRTQAATLPASSETCSPYSRSRSMVKM
jgi:pimeloyl-ACP methyl ester carboxylesterase